MEHDCQNCSRKFFSQGSGVSTVACSHCGFEQPERDQPSGTASDGRLRNMVDPATGKDMGGDPLTEGILGGSQPLYRRDESFASVHTASQTGQAIPSMPAGIHNGTMKALGFCGATINGMSPGNELFMWTMKEWLPAAREGNPQPVTVEVANDHPAYLAAALAIVKNSSACNNSSVPVPEFKTLIEGVQGGKVPPPQKQAKIAGPMDDFLEGFKFDPDEGPKATHKFIVTHHGADVGVHSMAEPTHHEEIAQQAGLDMNTFPKGHTLGLLNDDGSTEFYSHETPLHAGELAHHLGKHFDTPITVDPTLKPRSSEERFGIQPGAQGGNRRELQILNDPPMPRSKGVPLDRNEGLVRGGGTGLNTEPYIPYTVDEPITKEALLPLLAPIAVGAAGMIGRKLAPKLMKPALKKGMGAVGGGLKALGVSSLLKGVAGGGAAPYQPTQAPTLQAVTHITADVDTPTSNPILRENDGDTQQFKDQSSDTNPEHPNKDEASGSMSPATALLDHLMPHALEYYMSDEAGENDPLMKALDDALEREFPGYKDEDDGDHSDLEEFFKEFAHAHKAASVLAASPFYPGMGVPPQTMTPQPGGNAAIPHRQQPQVGPVPQQNACPSCGSQLGPDNSCLQCGFGQNPIDATQVNNAVTPGTSPGGPSVPPGVQSKVADTQGPYTPEQFKLVAEFLLAAGRELEIPHMYDAPWEYADVLAEVQNKQKPPPSVPEPAAPPAPEGMPPGMDPSMMDPAAGGAPPDPSMMQAKVTAALARFAADNIAPKCPKCGSHTTGINATEEGSTCVCSNCGNAWTTDDIKKVAEHEHIPSPHAPLEDGAPEHNGDGHSDPTNDLTWATPDGDPLTPGKEYEMHSEEYSVPDIIRVEAVKPNELVYSITGEYAELEDSNTISHDEAQERGYKFLPVEGESAIEDPPVDQLQNTEPTATSRVPITTAKVEPPDEAAWLLEGAASVPAPWEEPLPDLTGGPIEEVVASQGNDRDWLVADLPRTAGAKFSPSEQRTFIDEAGEARNLDRLDLEDTHYRTRETSVFVAGRGEHRAARPDMVDDDHLVFGL